MALFLFQWLVMMGAALAVKDRGHFGLDILVRKFPKSMIEKLDKFSQFIIFFVAIGMVYWGLILAKMTMLQTYATLYFPVGYSHCAIVVSGAFMAIFAVLNEIEDWNSRRGMG